MSANGVNGCARYHPPALSTSTEDFLAHSYDYIIIGGGTAGLTIAARLSENSDVTVGVLEAGSNKLDDPFVDVPGFLQQLQGNPEYDWLFRSEPQRDGKIHHYVRGKALGGSSAINYMMYVRGSLADYDDWATIVNDDSWSSANMMKYMRKHQTLEPIEETVLDQSSMPFVGEYHGTSGPVRTSFNQTRHPLEDKIMEACKEASGLGKTPKDPWSGDHIGFFNTLGAVIRTGPNKGKRSYAARGYFAANADRPNLHVLCDALVSQVELNGDTATGVHFSHAGSSHLVQAKREVIVCCGTIQSPQVLELSGIGDPAVLETAGVPCKIVNKGVGINFQDHLLTGGGWELTPGNDSAEVLYRPEVFAEAQKQLQEGIGPLTSISSMQGFFPYKWFVTEEEQAEILKSVQDSMHDLTPFQRKQHECILAHLESNKSANLQLIAVPAQIDWEGGVEDQSGLFPPLPEGQPMGFLIVIGLQYPLSRGTIHIKSSDPSEQPKIDPAFLAHPADVAVLAAGIRVLSKVEKSQALRDKIFRRVQPPAEVDMADWKQANDWVRKWTLGEFHPCGSCAMGDAVDTRLRVKGMKNLRVADASVFPNHVSGNIVSSVYAVAEKTADLIKEDWDYGSLGRAA